MRFPAHALARVHLTVAEVEDRLDAEHVAKERARTADPASTPHVFERVEHDDDANARDHAFNQRLDLLDLCPPDRRLRRRTHEEAYPERNRLRIDDLNLSAAIRELLGRLSRIITSRGEFAGDVNGHDVRAVRKNRLVGREEITRRGRRSRRQHLAPHELVVEEVVPDLGALFVRLVAEDHAQRHHRHAQLARQLGRHVGRAVGDDTYGQTRAPFRRQYSSGSRSGRVPACHLTD